MWLRNKKLPYKIVKKSGGYFVKTKSGPHRGRLHSKRPLSEEMAKRQMRALYASENGKSRLKGGSKKKSSWIQGVVSHMHQGLFTEKAMKYGMKPEEFANKVLSSPNNFDLKTRREAQFLVNIRRRRLVKGGDEEQMMLDENNKSLNTTLYNFPASMDTTTAYPFNDHHNYHQTTKRRLTKFPSIKGGEDNCVYYTGYRGFTEHKKKRTQKIFSKKDFVLLMRNLFPNSKTILSKFPNGEPYEGQWYDYVEVWMDFAGANYIKCPQDKTYKL